MRARITVRNVQRAIRVNVAALQDSAEEALRLCLGIRSKQSTSLGKLREVHVLLFPDR